MSLMWMNTWWLWLVNIAGLHILLEDDFFVSLDGGVFFESNPENWGVFKLFSKPQSWFSLMFFRVKNWQTETLLREAQLVCKSCWWFCRHDTTTRISQAVRITGYWGILKTWFFLPDTIHLQTIDPKFQGVPSTMKPRDRHSMRKSLFASLALDTSFTSRLCASDLLKIAQAELLRLPKTWHLF